MGYYLHRLKDGRTTYRGREIKDGNHGFLRRKVFGAPAFDTDRASLTYTMAPPEFTPAEYPLDVSLRLIYELESASRLRVTFAFQNRDPSQAAHVSFGMHPGFAVASMDQAEIILPAGRYRHHVAPDNFLSGEIREIDHPGGPIPFEKAALPGSFLLELPAEDDRRNCELRDPAGNRNVTVTLGECPYLTLWSDGRGRFVCIEPCWGLPDHHEQRPFEDKLGIQVIEPGGSLQRGFEILL